LRLFYTVHAKERMVKRFVLEAEILEALKFGEFNEQEPGKYEVEYRRVRVVFNYCPNQKMLTVVTAIPSKAFTREVRRYCKSNNISVRRATKILKGVA